MIKQCKYGYYEHFTKRSQIYYFTRLSSLYMTLGLELEYKERVRRYVLILKATMSFWRIR
jgi:hypothetical protein